MARGRYLVLGQACCHLGMMEDAMVLLQTGKRLATAAFRRQCVCWSDDSFSLSETPLVTTTELAGNASSSSESENVAHLLAHIKWLLRRRAAALAAMDAGADAEAIRHFTKILESRRGTPRAFLAECYIHRAGAYKSAGRVAEAIADCNRTMALHPASIPALTLRSQLLESIRAYPDCLRDLEHLKLLHDAILRDRKLLAPAWKCHSVRYSDLAGNLKSLTAKIQAMRQRLASMSGSEIGSAVDYHALMGLRRGCTRSEMERAHLVLTLRHRPDMSSSFVDRCEFMDEWDVEVVKDQARMSSLLLYRLLQKGYSYVMSGIMEAEAAEKQRKKAAAAVGTAARAPATTERGAQSPATTEPAPPMRVSAKLVAPPAPETTMPASVFQGVFCRDMAVVGSLLSQVGFNRPIPVKYEALSC